MNAGEHAEFVISIENNLENLTAISEFIESAMRHYGFDDEKIFDVNVAAEEACTNIIMHAYPEGTTGMIDLSCRMDEDKLHLIIRDYGKPFDPFTRGEPDLTSDVEGRKIGGLGIYFIRQLMDEYSYERRDDSSILTLIKHLKKETTLEDESQRKQ